MVFEVKRFLIWKKNNEVALPENTTSINIDFTEKAKVLSKILERAIINFIEPKGYRLLKNKHSNSWEIISSKDILNGSIEGLAVNRIVHFSPCFFYKENENNEMLKELMFFTNNKDIVFTTKLKNEIDIDVMKLKYNQTHESYDLYIYQVTTLSITNQHKLNTKAKKGNTIPGRGRSILVTELKTK